MVDQDRISEIADEVVSGYYDFKSAVREGCCKPHWMQGDSINLGDYRFYTLPTRPPLKHPDLAFVIHLSPLDANLSEDELRDKFHSQMQNLFRKPEAERYRVRGGLNG